ncbi:outer membrane channel protein TolC, partial [Vibrio alfacsensis]
MDKLNIDAFSPSLPADDVEALGELALQENLVGLENKIQQEIAKQDIDLAKSGHLPHLSLNA